MRHIRLSHKSYIVFAVMGLVLAACNAPAPASDVKALNSAAPGCPAVTLLTDKDFFPALLDAIDGAEREIYISIFSFKAGVHPRSYPDRILAHLKKAVSRGVEVFVILEVADDPKNSLTAQNLKTKALLEEGGICVYLDSPKKTTHTKAMVVDQKKVFLGSHNFTSSALKHNHELSVLIEQPQLAQNIRDYMLKIIKEAK